VRLIFYTGVTKIKSVPDTRSAGYKEGESMDEYLPIFLSLKLACVTTGVLLCIGIPLAYALSFSRSKWVPIWEALINLPLVLPPSVVGFYLLLLLGPRGYIGRVIEKLFNARIVFTFSGLVVSAVIFSLPFMVNSIKNGFSEIPLELIDAARSLGKSKLETLRYVILPNSTRSILNGIVLSFTHTIGGFGIFLMVGGNIPGKTRVASIAIYSAVESMDYREAHVFSLILIAVTGIFLGSVFFLNRAHSRSGGQI
jgi:molybdate transport system permease protein